MKLNEIFGPVYNFVPLVIDYDTKVSYRYSEKIILRDIPNTITEQQFDKLVQLSFGDLFTGAICWQYYIDMLPRLQGEEVVQQLMLEVGPWNHFVLAETWKQFVERVKADFNESVDELS